MGPTRYGRLGVLGLLIVLVACGSDDPGAEAAPYGQAGAGTEFSGGAGVATAGAAGAGVGTPAAVPGTPEGSALPGNSMTDMFAGTAGVPGAAGPGTATDGAGTAGIPSVPMAGVEDASGAGSMETDPTSAGAMEMAPTTAEEMTPSADTFALSSDVVENEGMLPAEYRCERFLGPAGPSPPLSWTPGPAGTMSYALIFKDTSPAGTTGSGVRHWAIYDIPATETGLPEAVPAGAMVSMPAGAKQVANDLSDMGYRGPCAFSGMNQYTFTLYALAEASLSGASSAAAVESAAMASPLATATLVVNSAP